MINVLVIFGTRPEAIKMAPVVKALKNDSSFRTMVCVTAQHREMLDQVLSIFEITPDYDLNLMKTNQTLSTLSSDILLSLDLILSEVNPDYVLVHGDTTTSAVASLAAFYRQIKVAHVEAGLRTYDKYRPWPEEVNRRITGVIADIHFAPTELARNNLISENVKTESIFVTGNTVIDALVEVRSLTEKNTAMNATLATRFSFLDPEKKLILVTGHRRENFGSGFESICLALIKIAESCVDSYVVYPVHLNPNVREPVLRIIGRSSPETQSRIHLIEPLDYVTFVYLLNRCYLVLTDSGGVQEEAPSFGKPVLVMRDTTERPEAVSAGTAKLVGTDSKVIFEETLKIINNADLYSNMASVKNPYGNGDASQSIVRVLKNQEKR